MLVPGLSPPTSTSLARMETPHARFAIVRVVAGGVQFLAPVNVRAFERDILHCPNLPIAWSVESRVNSLFDAPLVRQMWVFVCSVRSVKSIWL